MIKNPGPRRSGCPISYGLDIFGDKWTLLVLRDVLIEGKRCFREFLAAEEGIASNILAERLARLEHSGLLVKRRDPADRRQFAYAPTAAAIELLPALVELAYWGATHDRSTAAPRAFVLAYRKDRSALIEQMKAAVRRGAAGVTRAQVPST